MRKGKYSMHARLFENYKNGMILATYKSVIFACKQTEYYQKPRLLLFGI